ncbi:MAG TPA: hypothetical protein VIG47_04320, partial [Gemmatimonadaceae bacterium]
MYRTRIATALALATLVASGSIDAQRVKYPESRRGPTTDDYFGTKVADPYQWMEDLDSPATRAWISTQNRFTDSYLAQFPLRDTLRNRLTELFNYARVTAPQMIAGSRILYRRNTGLQNQAVLYMRDSIDAKAVTALDPNTLSPDGSVAFGESAPSPDGRYLAYSLAEGGADWRTVRVREIASMRDLAD